jgi:hypothetical protein
MNEQEKFEKEREKTLKELPDNVKAMFGQIGFYLEAPDDDSDDEAAAAAEKPSTTPPIIVPVLIMSPYDVPPKPVRDIYWFDFFSRAKRAKSLDKLAYLVYHYGADDPDDCYSFVEQEDFISYEEGQSKGYTTLPEDTTSTSTGDEEDIQRRRRGIQELLEDAEKLPGDRKRGNIDFLERHESESARSSNGAGKRKRET